MDMFLAAILENYGLDWVAMVFGVSAGYLLSQKDRRGIVCNVIACIASFYVAMHSHQYGFMCSSALTMGIMVRAYMKWQDDDKLEPSIAANECRQDAV